MAILMTSKQKFMRRHGRGLRVIPRSQTRAMKGNGSVCALRRRLPASLKDRGSCSQDAGVIQRLSGYSVQQDLSRRLQYMCLGVGVAPTGTDLSSGRYHEALHLHHEGLRLHHEVLHLHHEGSGEPLMLHHRGSHLNHQGSREGALIVYHGGAHLQQES